MDVTLENLGFDSFFEKQCEELHIELSNVARVIAEHKGVYYIKNAKGEFRAKVTGKQMFDALSREGFPAVGDWVGTAMIDNDQAVINQVLPRKTIIRKMTVSRKSTDKTKNQLIAANVDVAFVVESVDRDYSLNRIERYFAIAAEGNVAPAIILNKVDLISEEELAGKIAEISERFPNCMVLATSTQNLEGLDSLRSSLELGKTYCFLGSSGVGKSSLINALIGECVAGTGSIGHGTGRGKHVTTHREMYFLSTGGAVIDNPGMREVGSANSYEGVKEVFDEINNLAKQCQFADCSHVHEPGCAVVSAVETGGLDKEQYNNYIEMKKEAEHYKMTDFERRDKDKKFGKSLKQYHDRMEEFE